MVLVVDSKYGGSKAVNELQIECGRSHKVYTLNRPRYYKHFPSFLIHVKVKYELTSFLLAVKSHYQICLVVGTSTGKCPASDKSTDIRSMFANISKTPPATEQATPSASTPKEYDNTEAPCITID